MSITPGAGSSIFSAGSVTGSATVPKPTDLADKDVQYLYASWTDGQALATPSGWTKLGGVLAGTFFSWSLWRLITPSASSAVAPVLAYGGTGYQAAEIINLHGVDNTTPEDSSLGAIGSPLTSSSVTAPAVTAADINAYLLAFNSFAETATAGRTWNTASGWAQLIQGGNSSTTYFRNQIEGKQLTSSGSTGTQAFTTSSQPANGGQTMMLAVKSALVAASGPRVINRAALIRATSF